MFATVLSKLLRSELNVVPAGALNNSSVNDSVKSILTAAASTPSPCAVVSALPSTRRFEEVSTTLVIVTRTNEALLDPATAMGTVASQAAFSHKPNSSCDTPVTAYQINDA